MRHQPAASVGAAPPSGCETDDDDEHDVSVRLNDDDLRRFEADITLGITPEDDDDDDDDDDDVCSDKENRSAPPPAPPTTTLSVNNLLGERFSNNNKYATSFLTNTANNASHFNDLTNVSEANFFDMDGSKMMVPVNDDVSVSNLVTNLIRFNFIFRSSY